MTDRGWQALSLETIEPIPVAGVNWRPLRRELGIEAFGVNAYTANAGELVVEEHTEQALQHEEVYVVVTGAAIFMLDGERHEATAGTIVHIPNTHVNRSAEATLDGTTVLAIGGPVGRPYTPSAWEWAFAAQRHRAARDHDAALALLAEGLDYHPGNPSILYEIACWQTAAGDHDAALGALLDAVEADARCATWAQDDADLAPLRELPGFPSS